MKKISVTYLLFLFIIPLAYTQKRLDRYNHRHEIYVTGRWDKNYFDFFPSIGYDIAFNPKNRLFVSSANEYIRPLSEFTNFGNSLMSILKVNYQRQYLTAIGFGKKYNFMIKQNNWVGLAEYKYDLYRHKLTFSANILVERYMPIVPVVGGAATCSTGNCTIKPYYNWKFGISVGKYF